MTVVRKQSSIFFRQALREMFRSFAIGTLIIAVSTSAILGLVQGVDALTSPPKLLKLQGQVIALPIPQTVREAIYGRLPLAAHGRSSGCWNNRYVYFEASDIPNAFVTHIFEIALDCTLAYKHFPENLEGNGVIVERLVYETILRAQ